MTTKHREFVRPEPIPGFDCVQWKRQVHAEFQRETEGMTREEVLEYYRRGAERFDEETRRRRAEREKTVVPCEG